MEGRGRKAEDIGRKTEDRGRKSVVRDGGGKDPTFQGNCEFKDKRALP